MVEIVERGDPIGEADVAALEREVGTQLPESYRHFLLSNNGGRPRPHIIDIVDLQGGSTDIQIFFWHPQKFSIK